MSRRWADVAELVATQGLKGRLTVRPVRGLPFLLSEGLRVHFVPPTIDGPREAKVKEATHAGGHDWLVAFSGVKNLDTAEKLVGSHVIVERADLPEGFEEGASYATERIVGFEVEDETKGYVGEIVEVHEMPTQYLIVVETEEGEQVLIPFVEDFIVDVDEAEGVIYMDLPAGLVDMSEAEEE